jgi:TrmH family RNA methyltransferase
MERVITSTQNPLIKNLLLLQEKPRERKEQNLFVIEGIKEITQAAKSGFLIELVLFCQEIISGEELQKITGLLVYPVEWIEVTTGVFNRLAYRKNNGGIIALARPKWITPEDFVLSSLPLLLITETLEKPGNIGALLRTADAAGLDALIICDPGTDLYNPNTIRSSIGCLFTVQIAVVSTGEALSWLRRKEISIFGTALTASEYYHEADFKQPSAIVVGSEANGLSQAFLEGADHLIKIPQFGKIDSMNVSVSAAIVIFEALRQRGFPG